MGREWIARCRDRHVRHPRTLRTPQLSDEGRDKRAAAAKAVGDDLAMELLAVAASFRPARTQVGFIRRQQPLSGRVRLRRRTFVRQGVLTRRLVVELEIARDRRQVFALRVSRADQRVECQPLGLHARPSLLDVFPTSVHALWREYLHRRLLRRERFGDDHLLDVAAVAIEDTLDRLVPVG